MQNKQDREQRMNAKKQVETYAAAKAKKDSEEMTREGDKARQALAQLAVQRNSFASRATAAAGDSNIAPRSSATDDTEDRVSLRPRHSQNEGNRQKRKVVARAADPSSGNAMSTAISKRVTSKSRTLVRLNDHKEITELPVSVVKGILGELIREVQPGLRMSESAFAVLYNMANQYLDLFHTFQSQVFEILHGNVPKQMKQKCKKTLTADVTQIGILLLSTEQSLVHQNVSQELLVVLKCSKFVSYMNSVLMKFRKALRPHWRIQEVSKFLASYKPDPSQKGRGFMDPNSFTPHELKHFAPLKTSDILDRVSGELAELAKPIPADVVFQELDFIKKDVSDLYDHYFNNNELQKNRLSAVELPNLIPYFKGAFGWYFKKTRRGPLAERLKDENKKAESLREQFANKRKLLREGREQAKRLKKN